MARTEGMERGPRQIDDLVRVEGSGLGEEFDGQD